MKITKTQNRFACKRTGLLWAMVLALFLLSPSLWGQVTIGEDTSPRDFSLLEVVSNGTGGLRLPRLTTVERDALKASEAFQAEITGKAKGLTIYNISIDCVEVWNGSTWISTCAPSLSSVDCDAVTQYIADNETITEGVSVNITTTLPYLGKVGSDISLADNTLLGSSGNGLEVRVDGNQTLSDADGNINIKITGTTAAQGSISIPITVASAGCNISVTSNAPYISSIDCDDILTQNIKVRQYASVNVVATLPYTKVGGNITLTGNPLLGTKDGLSVYLNGTQTLTDTNGNISIKITGTTSALGPVSIPITVAGVSCNIIVTSDQITFIRNYNVNSSTSFTLNTSVIYISDTDTGDATTNGLGVDKGNVSAGVFRYQNGIGESFSGYSGYDAASGLTVTVPSGTLANGAGVLAITVSGTLKNNPLYAGKAFDIPVTILGRQLYVRVHVGCGAYTSTTRNIGSLTGDTNWLQFQCYNLGADTSIDPFTYVSKGDLVGKDIKGDLYQWGRWSDGHQSRTSNITSDKSAVDRPGSDFIPGTYTPFDWRDPQKNTLWGNGTQDENVPKGTVNDPCPAGWKVPSAAQWRSIFNGGTASGPPSTATANTWMWTTNGQKVGDALFLPITNYRYSTNGEVDTISGPNFGYYWSSTINPVTSGGIFAFFMSFGEDKVNPVASIGTRASGYAVRCVRE